MYTEAQNNFSATVKKVSAKALIELFKKFRFSIIIALHILPTDNGNKESMDFVLTSGNSEL